MRNKGKRFEWNAEAQVAFENIKRELCEAPVLGMPTEKGMYVLDTDASVVAISGILHQEQEWNGRTVHLRGKVPRILGERSLQVTRGQQSVILVEDLSMDQSYIGRWIVRLDGYHMVIEHRMRDKHQNAESLSKKTEF